MKRITQTVRNLLQLRNDSLYMNSVYMMASTALVSGSGFIFWLLCAHLYNDTQVGLATALISVVSFIMNLSILGLNYSLIRFLPKSKQKNQLLTTSGLAISTAAALCVGLFLWFLPVFSPKLAFIQENPLTMLAFFFFSIAISLDYATESIFLAFRAGKYIFFKNSIVSIGKLFLPLLFVSLGAIGIFLSWVSALSSALLLSIFILIRRFGFRPTRLLSQENFSHIVSFSSANFFVGILGITPGLLLPLLITNTMNPAMTAYFYISFMIANLLYTVPYATTQSLFAEGSHDESAFFAQLKKAGKLIGILLTLGIAALLLFGNFVLSFFGESYSSEGIHFLYILAFAGIPVSINYLGLTIVNLKRKMKALMVINTIGTSSILVLSYILREYSLLGIGIAWLIGHVIKSVLYTGYIAKLMRK